MNTGNWNCDSFRKGARDHNQNDKNSKKNSPRKNPVIIVLLNTLCKFRHEAKKYIANCTSKDSFCCITELRTASKKEMQTIKQEYDDKMKTSVNRQMSFSFVQRPELAVPLGCERLPPPRCLHLADANFDLLVCSIITSDSKNQWCLSQIYSNVQSDSLA